VEQDIHLTEQERQRLGLDPVQRGALQAFVVLGALSLFAQMLEGLDQKASGASGGGQNGFRELLIDCSND
jgi:hypothetical protein